MKQLELSTGWQVKARRSEVSLEEDFRSEQDWIEAKVPGSVHEALFSAGRIGDPYAVDEQAKSAWISEQEFLYRCRFDLGHGFLGLETAAELCFEGLDTVATVWLNGHELLHSDNMFLPATAKVAALLRRSGNELWIRFEPALRASRTREEQHGQRPVWNGDPSRVYLRKAQYQYGWDFGPTLLGAGPWKPVRLLSYEARLAEVHAPFIVAADLGSAALSLSASIRRAGARTTPGALPLTLSVALYGPDGAPVHESSHAVRTSGNEPFKLSFSVPNPALWWPRGHGGQPLYRLQLGLFDPAGQTLDEQSLRLGARRLRLVQEPLPGGKGFYFEINNRPIFCGGANWIPPDLLPTRIRPDRYRALIAEAANAHMTMLRVWGGGIYEDDLFYDLCDEQGILVWQDFLFACGLYPAYEEFAHSVAAEAETAIRRLRHHPSLVIWAGNNEDYSIAASVRAYHGPEEPIVPPGPSSLKKPIFDGRRIYEEVLAKACAHHDPSRPYWPGSPYSLQAVDPNAPSEGDRHIWEIWHFPMLDYQDYVRVAGRFASEFGMQAAPDAKTLQRGLGARPLSEEALALLNKGQDGPGRIRHYIERNLPPQKGTGGSLLETYLYSTQLIQAEALAYAVRGFRRQFDASRHGGGALVWQFDDCWPGVSWSILAFCDEGEAVRRKPSYYALRRELAPWAIGLAPGEDAQSLALWVVAPPAAERTARLRLRAFTLAGELHGVVERELALVPNLANELEPARFAPSATPLVYGAQLFVGGSEEAAARAVLWPQPLSRLTFEDPGLRIERDGDRLLLSVARPAKGVLLSTDVPIDLSDNLLDILPDEPLAVLGPGLSQQPQALRVRSLAGEICF